VAYARYKARDARPTRLTRRTPKTDRRKAPTDRNAKKKRAPLKKKAKRPLKKKKPMASLRKNACGLNGFHRKRAGISHINTPIRPTKERLATLSNHSSRKLIPSQRIHFSVKNRRKPHHCWLLAKLRYRRNEANAPPKHSAHAQRP
jgi:hypothetical protein